MVGVSLTVIYAPIIEIIPPKNAINNTIFMLGINASIFMVNVSARPFPIMVCRRKLRNAANANHLKP